MPELYHPACYLRELHPAHDVVAGSEADGAPEGGEKSRATPSTGSETP